MATSNSALGEILSSSITGFTAEYWHEGEESEHFLETRPRFGSILKVCCEDAALDIFAVVTNVVTGPKDSVHKPVALKMKREQLRREQPHIFSLLKTEIIAAVVGYAENGRYFTSLPPHPPLMHDFVYLAGKEEVRTLTDDLDYLRHLSRVTGVPTVELVAAAVRESILSAGRDYDYLLAAGQYLVQIFQDNFEALETVLKKLQMETALSQ